MMTGLQHSTLLARDADVIGAIGRLRFSPLAPKGGEGCYLIDQDDRRILDLSASGCPAILGYNHPSVANAVAGALASMPGASHLLYPNEAAVALAETLLRDLPLHRAGKVWFGFSGSDASDCAVRVLQAATGRNRFISFVGSYHGGSGTSMSVSGHTSMTHTLPRPGLLLLPYPDQFRGRFSPDEILALLDFHLSTSTPASQVAAIFLEPLMSDGGLLVPPPGFLEGIQKRCREHDIMLVVDEVKVGLGRTGHLHAFMHDQLEPDMVIFGKGLGGGVPLSAVVGPATLMDHAPAFAVQTMSGNPVSAAAGLAVLDTIEREGLVSASADKGRYLQNRLRDVASRQAVVGDVRGRGLAVGVDLVATGGTRAAASAVTSARVIYRAYQLGAAFIYNGLEGNVLELTPPLTITYDEIDEGVRIIERALSDVQAGAVTEDEVGPYLMW